MNAQRRFKNARLREIASLERNVVDPSDIDDGTLYVGLEHILSDGSFSGVSPVRRGELQSSKFTFSDQHVLYGKLRPYLAKIARPTFSGVCSTDILPILPGPDLSRDFLAHFLRQPRMIELATAQSTGANLPRLSPMALENFEIPLPPLVEQRRIASILDKADDLRTKRRAALVQLELFAPSVFVNLFGDPDINPNGWAVHTLGELICAGPQNGLYRPASDYGSGTPILRIDNFYDGAVTDVRTLKRVRITDEERANYALHDGDIVVNRVNSREYLGKSTLVPALSEPTVFESNMMRFEVDRRRIDPGYLIHFLQTARVRRHILKSAKDAVNQSSINQQDVKALSVLVPPLSRQQDFLRCIALTKQCSESQELSLGTLNALFESLQSAAFSGDL